MAVAFTQISWLWGGKEHEATVSTNSNPSAPLDIGTREPDSVKFPSFKGTKFPSRKIRRKWQSRDERRRIDREYDIVLVPSDGGCMSGSDSDDSDWSIGWLEPHAPGFQSDDDSDSSFAVLVPCYGRPRSEPVESPQNQMLGAILSNLSSGNPTGSLKYCSLGGIMITKGRMEVEH
ncbi:hypothetical protein AMTR_s00033p00234310 [Amborella trichopoda]|uniref:Uncharacterized protein n=1 Tax=Amborella trichopoda TaxID=13333 RepID=U5CWR2_AMBTC|nr:hypothetical protein AMTR_s00033p00234310 [Amborella trichopoda]